MRRRILTLSLSGVLEVPVPHPLGHVPIVLVTAVVIYIQMFTAYTDAGGLTFAMEILNSMPHTCDEGFLGDDQRVDGCMIYRVKDPGAKCTEDNFDRRYNRHSFF